MKAALEGIKVVEVAQVAAVPMAGRHLADFGADVVHVEPKTGDSWRAFKPGEKLAMASGAGEYINHNWENYNRNKRSICLDLSTESGYGILLNMLSRADVFLTNLRMFEREKFRLEYKTLHRLYPRLIYGSLTGYGRNGPDSNNPAYDSISYWARSGMGHLFSNAGDIPFIDGGGIGDNVAGLGLALGVMIALFAREKTGKGQEVDLSLLHTGMYQLTYYLAGALSTGRDVRHWGALPRYDSPNPIILPYETSDKRWLLLAMPQADRWWARFCEAIGKPELVLDARFTTLETRDTNHAALIRILETVFSSQPLDVWRSKMNGIIPFSPYQTLTEILDDPQVKANGYLVRVDHPTHGELRVIDNPVRLSETPPTIRTSAPEVGQHTEELLLEHGYTWADIACFREEGAI